MRTIKTFVLGFLTTALFFTAVAKSSQMYPFPVKLAIEPVPMPTAAGTVNLRVKIICEETCEETIMITVSEVDNLEYAGETQFHISTKQNDTMIVNLSVVIPENDTSGVGLTCHYSVRGKFRSEAYFISEREKVSYFPFNPRGVRKAPKKLIDMSDPPMTEEQGEGKTYVGYYDEEKNWVPEDSVKNGLSPSGKRVGNFNAEGIFISLDSLHKLGSQSTDDTTSNVMKEGDRSKTGLVNKDGSRVKVDRQWLLDSLKKAKIEAEYENMRLKEQTPLTRVDKQDIEVDGKTYRRLRGEYKFHLIESTTDRQGFAERYKDSLNILKGKVFEYNFDLRDSTHLEYARTKIDNLNPTDSAGFFRATINWQTVLDLRKKGIVFRKIGWKPKVRVMPNDSESTEKKNEMNPPPRNNSNSLLRNPQNILFSESIEGAFPGTIWTVGDSVDEFGYEYWDDRS